MNNTVIYIIVFVALAHFVAAVVFLLVKLSGPSKGKSQEDPDTPGEKLPNRNQTG